MSVARVTAARVTAACIAALLMCAPASAQVDATQRYVAGDVPILGRRAPEGPPIKAEAPAFGIAELQAAKTADGYEARVRLARSRPTSILVQVELVPPAGDTAEPVRVRETTDDDVATLLFSDVTPAWGIRADATDGQLSSIATTRVVPLGSLTGEGIADEVRAWPQGARFIGDIVDDRSPCNPPANASLDGFKAAVVQEKAVFTLHLADAPGRVRTFEGAPVTGQRVLIKIATDETDPSKFVGVAFDPVGKGAAYVDATVSPPQQFGAPKVDVLGRNVLIKTGWRFGNVTEAFRPDGTFGTIARDAFVRASSEISTADTRCVIETASVRYDVLAPRVRASATPAPVATGGASPYAGLIIAFGGIGVIVALALLSRRRAQNAGRSTSAPPASDD